jgi:hypothetical protein
VNTEQMTQRESLCDRWRRSHLRPAVMLFNGGTGVVWAWTIPDPALGRFVAGAWGLLCLQMAVETIRGARRDV